MPLVFLAEFLALVSLDSCFNVNSRGFKTQLKVYKVNYSSQNYTILHLIWAAVPQASCKIILI